jgi:hypothetical protein
VRVDSQSVDFGIVNVPYQFQIAGTAIGVNRVATSIQGTLPPGISLTNATLSGTPTKTGVYQFTYTISDADKPAIAASRDFTLQILSPGTVRNDSLASATALACCGNIHASFSPYSTAAGVAKPDQDFYRITATPSQRVSVDAVAIGTSVDTDPLIEILDANGARMTTCKTPQISTSFTQSCMNDDVDPGIIRGAHLDVQLPGTSGVFVVHVLDWGGRARPEMTYQLKMAKLP